MRGCGGLRGARRPRWHALVGGSVRRTRAVVVAGAFLVALATGTAPAAAVSSSPDLVASPDDPRAGEQVSLSGSGWDRASDPDDSSGGVDFAALDDCILLFGGTPATEGRCATSGGGTLDGGLTVPVGTKPGTVTILACAPDCSSNLQARVQVTVRPGLVVVPDLDEQTYDEAQASLAAQGLVLDPDIGRPDDADAVVTEQSPDAGDEVEEGTEVGATFEVVSPNGNNDEVAVPDLSGLRLGAARRALQADGLQLAVDPDSGDEGRVDDQDPAAGTLVDPGTVVTVTLRVIEAGLVAVPDVVGFDLDEAQAVIEGAGLILRADSTDDGSVLRQNPGAGTLVPLGSVVGVGLEAPAGGPEWWMFALAGGLAVGAVGAGILKARKVRSRRDRSWVREHVSVEPGESTSSYDVASAGPSHTVRLEPREPSPVTVLEEIKS